MISFSFRGWLKSKLTEIANQHHIILMEGESEDDDRRALNSSKETIWERWHGHLKLVSWSTLWSIFTANTNSRPSSSSNYCSIQTLFTFLRHVQVVSQSHSETCVWHWTDIIIGWFTCSVRLWCTTSKREVNISLTFPYAFWHSLYKFDLARFPAVSYVIIFPDAFLGKKHCINDQSWKGMRPTDVVWSRQHFIGFNIFPVWLVIISVHHRNNVFDRLHEGLIIVLT